MAKKKHVEEPTEKILDINAAIQGTVVFKDPVNLRINGDFTGQLDTKGSLTVGPDAKVEANITGDVITVAGTVTGDITVSEKLIVTAPARITGDIQAPSLSVGEGAVIDGVLRMAQAGNSVERLLTLSEVAEYLEVEDSVVLDWAKQNKIPGTHHDNEWQFKKAEVEAWVQREQVKV